MSTSTEQDQEVGQAGWINISTQRNAAGGSTALLLIASMWLFSKKRTVRKALKRVVQALDQNDTTRDAKSQIKGEGLVGHSGMGGTPYDALEHEIQHAIQQLEWSRKKKCALHS